ncbi:fungal-specific transcription factor domain-containing protein [Xylaria palmicola]|nr:fungal-specific transcription factor domain-containing protein [Xylaria palmicola]
MASPSKKVPTARSFGGCDTCRSRRVKCDESKPFCRMCESAGLTCQGYVRNIFFVSTDTDASITVEDRMRHRRLLFTESERRHMSEQLVSALPHALVSTQLSGLDEAAGNTTVNDTLELRVGPYGVLRSGTLIQSSSDNAHAKRINQSCDTQDSDTIESGNSVREKLYHSTTEAQEAQKLPPSSGYHMLHGYFQDVSSLSLDLPDISDVDAIMEQDEETTSTTEFHSLSLASGVLNTFIDSQDFIQQKAFSTEFWPAQHSHAWASGLPPPLPAHIPMPIPRDAVLLLKHYTSNIVNLMTPFGHSKTPWHTLFLPEVRSCLAALTMGDDVCRASLTIFLGVLAISASSWGRMSPSRSMWRERGKLYARFARQHCRAMLKTAYDVPKVTKYKTTLMALLTMADLHNVIADHKRLDFYLVEAEKFIRLRGLNRIKSRKARILHHCYAFRRIFYESLCIESNNPHRHQVRKAIESSGSSIYSSDSLSFHVIPNWRNMPQTLLNLKTREECENDLHVALPGKWPGTLFPEIYGIPEMLLFFLSCVIRLRQAKDAGTQYQSPVSFTVADFLDFAKILETCMKHYEQQVDTEKQPLEADYDRLNQAAHFTSAVQNALAIYFYRNVYNVDTSLLQPMVSNVLASLTLNQSVGPSVAHGALCLVWPAYIAACEAEDATVRKAFSEWFATCAQNSGLRTFDVTLKAVNMAWIHRSLNQQTSTDDWTCRAPQD